MRLVFAFWVSILLGVGAEGEKIVKGAKEQIGVTTSYDPAYVAMEFPGGDVISSNIFSTRPKVFSR